MKATRRALILVSLVFSSALTGVVLGLKHDPLPATTPPSGQWFDYVVNIMLENHSINFTYYNGGSVNSCIGNCTYFTSLANSNGLALGLTDGSINASTASYIAITSGYGNAAQECNSGPNAAGCPYLQIPNIVDRLENAGLTWKAYMEGYPQPPSGCFTNYNSQPPFYYTPNHNPFLYYQDIVNNTARCARIVTANSQPVTQSSTGCWPSALQNDDVLIKDLNSVTNASNYMWLTPNTIDQTHDCNDVSLGNAWLNKLIPQILGTTLFKTKRAALFITFDEPGCTNPAGQPPCPTPPSQNVYSVWASNPSNPTTRSGFKSTQSYLLYSPLRAVESNWALPTLTANDASANNMAEFFAVLSTSITYSPSSIQPGQQVTFTASSTGGAAPYSYSWRFGDGATATGNPATHTYSNPGTYNAQLTVTDKLGATKNATQTITVGPNFAVLSNPSSVILRTGSSNTSKIILSSINNFSGAVSLTTSVSSSGLTASLNATSISLVPGTNASSTLTVSSATPGTYAVNVTGTSGLNIHLTTITVRVTTADFGITANPTILTISPSTTGALTIQLVSLNQFSGTVSLSTSVSPSGLLPSLTPPTISLSSGTSVTSTLSVSSLNYGNYTVTVTGVAGPLSHSTTATVRVFPSSVVVASDSTSGTTSLYTTGGQKLIQDSAGKIIAVYVDNSGRISLSYDNTDPSHGGWSTPAKSPTPSSAYSWPAAVLVSLTLLRIIAVGGSVPGAVVDIPVTISRGSGNNVTGFSFGTPTTLDSSGLGKYTAATILHNNDILAAWGWENSTTSILKSLRWDPTTGWTSLSGSTTIPDNVFVDKSIIQYFVSNMIERPDNHNIYMFALRFVSSGRIAFGEASWSGSAWSWGTTNLTYETNASDADDDAIGLSWDPSRSLVVADYGISGTHTYGVFSLTATDVKTHLDTPTLAVTGDRGWGAIGVQTNTGDYCLFLISVNSDAGSGTLGYIRMPSGEAWNATITWINTATDNQVTSLRFTGPSPSLDLLYVEGTSAPASVKFVRLGAPSFSIIPSPTNLSVLMGSTGTSTLALSSLYNFAGTVNLSATVSPSGVTATLTPAALTLTSGITAISTLSFNPTTSGVYTITIRGTNGLISSYATITITVTDFNIAASPTTVAVATGATGTSAITITAVNGLTGTVTLFVSASTPAGLTCTLPANVTFGPSPQILTLSCSATAANTYTVIVTGSDGTLSRTTATITFTVVDFALAAGAVSPTQIPAGSSGTSTITVTALNGLAGTVALSVSASTPAGLNCIQPASVTFGSSPQTATLSCGSSAANTYTVTVTGTDGTLSHTTAAITFVVADFSISAGGVTPAQILASGSGSSIITVTAINGLTGTVALTVSASTPAGVSCAFTPTSVTFGAGQQTSSLSCTSGTANTYTITVTGTDGTMSHATAAIIFVVVDFSISAGAVNPAQILAGGSGTSTITVTALNGLTETVTLSVSGSTPVGLTCILPASVTLVNSSATATLSCSSAIANTYSVTITGTAGPLSHTSATLVFIVVDFAIVASSPSPPQVLAGTTSTSTVTLTSLNGFTGLISLAMNSTSCSLSSSAVTGSGNSVLSCTFATAETIGVTVTATSGLLSRSTSVAFNVQDFGVSASPTSAFVNAGALSTSAVTVSGMNGFDGVVSLTTNSTACTISPPTLTGSGTANLSCGFAAVSTVLVALTGASSSLLHSSTITYIVQDFAINASSPGPSNVNSSTNSTIMVSALNLFSGTISLTPVVPVGLSCSLTPTTLSGSGTALLSCNSPSPGNYNLTITATSTNLVHSTTLVLGFQDYAITASSVPAVSVSSSAVSTFSVTTQNGFSGTVSLSYSLQSGLYCGAITPSSIKGSGRGLISCSSPTAGNYTLTITATSATLAHSVVVTFMFGDFTVAVSTPSATSVGQTAPLTINVTSVNHFSGTVLLSDIPQSGMSCLTISPTSLIGQGSAIFSCTGGSAGNYELQVLAVSGSLTRSSSVMVQFSDFGLSAGPSVLQSFVGGNATFTITVTSLNGYSGTVQATSQALNSASVGPNGLGGGRVTLLAPLQATLSLLVNPGSQLIVSNGIGQYALIVTIPLGMQAGNYTIFIKATDGQISHITQVTLVVTDFSFTSPTNTVSIVQGNNATITLSLQSLNGLQGNINISSTINPSGPSSSLSPSSVFLITGVSIVLVINIPSNVQPGNYTLTLQAAIGTLSHTVVIVVQVQSGTSGLFARLSSSGATTGGVAGLLSLFLVLHHSMRNRRGSVQSKREYSTVMMGCHRRELHQARLRVVVASTWPPMPASS